jgi:vacuolar-type H+-ATPase subunit E/Vma4
MSEGGIVSKIIQASHERGRKLLEEASVKHDAELAAGLTRVCAEIDARRLEETARILESESQAVSAVRLAERNATLSLKRRLLDRVYEEAWEKSLDPTAFLGWIEGQCKAYCRDGDAIIVADQQADLFRGRLADLIAQIGVRVWDERGGFRAGFIVDRGAKLLNCTLDEAMKAAVRDTEIEVSRVLFR